MHPQKCHIDKTGENIKILITHNLHHNKEEKNTMNLRVQIQQICTTAEQGVRWRLSRKVKRKQNPSGDRTDKIPHKKKAPFSEGNTENRSETWIELKVQRNRDGSLGSHHFWKEGETWKEHSLKT